MDEFTGRLPPKDSRIYAEFPPVNGAGGEIGEYLATSKRIAKVAFTGGDATGAAIYAKAAAGMKHASMELGGKSPNIIFADANLDDAVKGAISGIFAA